MTKIKMLLDKLKNQLRISGYDEYVLQIHNNLEDAVEALEQKMLNYQGESVVTPSLINKIADSGKLFVCLYKGKLHYKNEFGQIDNKIKVKIIGFLEDLKFIWEKGEK